MTISFVLNDEVVEFASEEVIDGFYDYLTEQQINGQIEGVIYFVDNLLRQEKAKFETLSALYFTQSKQTDDAELKQNLNLLSARCAAVAEKIGLIVGHPAIESELFKENRSQYWADLQTATNAFDEFTLKWFADNLPLAAEVIPAPPLVKAVIGLALQETKQYLYSTFFWDIVRDEFQTATGIDIIESQGAFVGTKIDGTLVFEREERGRFPFLSRHVLLTPSFRRRPETILPTGTTTRMVPDLRRDDGSSG